MAEFPVRRREKGDPPKNFQREGFFPSSCVDEIVRLVGKPLKKKHSIVDLREDLENTAGKYSVMQAWDAEPNAKKRHKNIAAVAKAAQTLLKTIGASEPGSIQNSNVNYDLTSAANLHAEKHGEYPEFPATLVKSEALGDFLDYNGLQATLNAVEGVRRLQQWASEEAKRLLPPAQEQTRKHDTQKKLRVSALEAGRELKYQKEQSAKGWLIKHGLPSIYEKYFGPYRISKPYGKTDAAGGPGITFVQACLSRLGINIGGDAIEKHYVR